MPNEENLKPFKEGFDERRNYNGRPKGAKNRSTIVRQFMELKQKQKNPITGVEEELTQEEIMALAMIYKARGGSVHAWTALMDSAYGKALETVDMKLTDERPVEIIEIDKTKAQKQLEEQSDSDDE